MRRSFLTAAAIASALFILSLSSIGIRGTISEFLLPLIYSWEYANRAMDPRLPPSPVPLRRDLRLLKEQNTEMEASLEKDFLIKEGKLLLLDTEPVSLGDVCLWQGVYAATAILRWKQDPSPKTLKFAEAAFDGLLVLSSKGLPIARSVYPASLSSEPGGIQYFRDEKLQWKEDASVDSTAGWVFGAIAALRFLPSREKEASAALKFYADTLIANGYQLKNSDGSQTRFHRVGGSIINSPVGVLTSLAALKALSSRQGGEIYAREHSRFRRERQDRWGALGSGPFLWRNATTNHNIAHLALAAALLAEDDPKTAGRYMNGLARLERLTVSEGNSFWIYLSIWVLDDLKKRGVSLSPAAESWLSGRNEHFARARPAMLEWNFPHNKEKRERLNSERSEILWTRWPFGPRVPKRPIPLWQRPAADFVWQRPARALDDWRRLPPELKQRFSPLDFMAAYRLGRAAGAISPQD